jgi:3-oxoacyl-[acyl-carrier protein] reductase
MSKNIFIVGIGGSLGNAIHSFYKDKYEFKVFGSTTKKEKKDEFIFYLDLMDYNSIEALPQLEIDHLIITSGCEPKYNIINMTESHLQTMFGIHVLGPMLLIQKVKSMLKENSSITFISSPAAWQGSYDPTYAAVKGAVNSLVRTLAKDFAPKTRVNALSPSLIENSTVFNGMTADFKQRHIDRALNKRLLTLAECVEGIDFILKNKHYTGQILHLNGGMIYG